MNNRVYINLINKELEKIQNFFIAQNYDEVINKTKVLIKKYPKVTPFYNAIALAYKEKSEYELAKSYLEKALRINSRDSNVFCNLGLVSKAENDYHAARGYYEKAIKINPQNLIVLINFGNLMSELKDSDGAIEFYLKALKINQNIPEIHLNLANLYKSIGNLDSCIKHCDVLNKKFPQIVAADQILSKIIDYNKEKIHQDLMLKKINNKEININDLIILNFSIAKSYEDQKKFDKAIFYIDAGNKLQNKTYNDYNIENDKIIFSKIINGFKKYKEDFKVSKNILNKKVIFIVGLPRSGTTLLHQILSNHPSVFGSGELVFFNNPILKWIDDHENKVQPNKIAKNLYSEFFKLLAEMKVKEDIIVEKTPENFIWLGFLKCIFPNCKIIHCKRNIKDTAFSIYKHLFGKNSYKWSYNQESLSIFISEYLKIMDFWSAEFNDEIFNNDYIELINNPKNQAKKIFKYCDLDWSDKFLNIENSKNFIESLSSTQARKPIYKSSINFYKNYEGLTDIFDKIIPPEIVDKKKAPSN